MSISLLLVEDHEIVRDGLLALLEPQKNITVVGLAADGRAAVEMAQQLAPDIVLMDIGLPRLNGIEATREILAVAPKSRIIILTVRMDQACVQDALQAGASGYLLKESGFHELQSAIEQVAAGKLYLSPQISSAIISTCFGHKSTSGFTGLSGREREVLQLVAEGLSTKEIAAALHVSVKTVETHRTRIMSRLNLHNIAQLTRYAVREGLANLNP